MIPEFDKLLSDPQFRRVWERKAKDLTETDRLHEIAQKALSARWTKDNVAELLTTAHNGSGPKLTKKRIDSIITVARVGAEISVIEEEDDSPEEARRAIKYHVALDLDRIIRYGSDGDSHYVFRLADGREIPFGTVDDIWSWTRWAQFTYQYCMQCAERKPKRKDWARVLRLSLQLIEEREIAEMSAVKSLSHYVAAYFDSHGYGDMDGRPSSDLYFALECDGPFTRDGKVHIRFYDFMGWLDKQYARRSRARLVTQLSMLGFESSVMITARDGDQKLSRRYWAADQAVLEGPR